MIMCLCEPIVVHAFRYEGANYAGMECRLCGARNVSNNARPGTIDRVVVDMLVGWMTRRDEIAVDPDTGDLIAFRVSQSRAPMLGIEKGGLSLAAMNHPQMEMV